MMIVMMNKQQKEKKQIGKWLNITIFLFGILYDNKMYYNLMVSRFLLLNSINFISSLIELTSSSFSFFSK